MSIALVMVVKNEARGLAATLRSVARAGVKLVELLDTGSSDGTGEVADRECRALGLSLIQRTGPFVDFSDARNRALEGAYRDLARLPEGPHFALMLSGDETLEEVEPGCLERAARMCQQRPEPGAWDVQVAFGALDYDSPRLTLSDSPWRYQGKTHEALRHPGGLNAAPRLYGVRIVHSVKAWDAAERRKRWALDAELLEREHLEQPDNPRTVFYLAQSYDCLGEWDKAAVMYTRRAEMGGWVEERGIARLRLGRMLATRGDWPAAEREFLHSFAIQPRPEPMLEIARHYYKARHWPAVALFARVGLQAPGVHQLRLFVERDAQGWALADLLSVALWNMHGPTREGLQLAEQALGGAPNDPRLAQNLAHYKRALGLV